MWATRHIVYQEYSGIHISENVALYSLGSCNLAQPVNCFHTYIHILFTNLKPNELYMSGNVEVKVEARVVV